MTLVHPYLKLPQLRTFPRPTGLRQTMNTQQQTSVGERYVRTNAELRAAIGECAAAGQSSGAGAGDVNVPFGFSICMVGPIRISEPIIIPVECSGLHIRQLGRVPLLPDGVVSTVFDVRAALVTISDLLVVSESIADMFTAFVTLGATQADRCRVLHNHVVADRVFLSDATNDATRCIILGNQQQSVNDTHDAPIVINGSRNTVEANHLADGDGVSDVITVASGARNRIIGNYCDGGDITTTASSGNSAVWFNDEVGTLALHGTDSSGGNT